MPSSAPDHIPAVLKHVMKLQPKRVLDVGVGYGKWGFLLREYLESWNDRVHPEDWEITITGVEVWEPYTRLPWMREIYTNMVIQDVRVWIQGRVFHELQYDVAICGDVLEHMPKEDAIQVLNALLGLCGEVIVNVPIGKEWLNNQIVDGNPYEKHQCAWEHEELEHFDGATSELISDYSVGKKRVATYVLKKRKPAPAAPVQPDCTPSVAAKRTILHVHNVQQIGGTGNFVYDFARSFPEFNHVALAVNDRNGDPTWLNWVSHHMKPVYAPKLTRQIVEEFDPVCVILHNTAGRSVDCDHHLKILEDRYTIFVHHNPTRPLFETNVDVDVFVSGFVMEKYATILSRMKARRQIPPCVFDLGDFGKLYGQIPNWHNLQVTAAGKAGKEFKQAMPTLPLSVDLGPETRGMNVMPGYLKRFNTAIVWSGLDESWCRTVTECMAAGMIVVAKDQGAIREQIIHRTNGFMFGTQKELLEIIRDLQYHMSIQEKEKISQAAHAWAIREVGPDRMRRDYYPLLTRALMRS